MIRFLYRNLSGYRVLVTVAIALTVVAVGSDLLTAFPLKFILDKVVHHQDPVFPLAGGLLDRLDAVGTRNGLVSGETHTILSVVIFSMLFLFVVGAIGAVVAYVQLHIAVRVGQGLSVRLRTLLFEHIAHLGLAWHGRQRTGDLVQRISGNIADIEKLVTDGLVDLLSGFLALLGFLLVMLLINWQFTLVSMIIVPALFAAVLGYTKRIKRANKRAAKSLGEVAEIAAEDIGAITEVKAFTLEQREARHFARYVEKLRGFAFYAGRRQAEFTPLVLFLVIISNVAIIGVGGWIAAGHGHFFTLGPLTIAEGSITVGSLAVFITYSKQLYQPMRNLSKLVNLYSSAASGAERIQEVLNQPREVAGGSPQHQEMRRFQGTISYHGVEFGYTDGRPVLEDIELHIPAGHHIALVGLSGSGKTTLVKLMPRFYEIWNGGIEIDGVNIRDYPLPVLRQNIALVLQDSVLFEGTVRENIALGRPDADFDEVVEAARQAHMHETIMSIPGGYEAQVREQGKNFSSGQRQRIAIARALLRDAPILILDEPTASLDVEAEAEVMAALERLVTGRTTVMISHRLSLVGNADAIVVLSGGRIAEQGTYDELRTRGGVFSHLLQQQTRYAGDHTAERALDGHRPSNGRRRVKAITKADLT